MLKKADFWLSLALLALSGAVLKTAWGFDEIPSRFPELLAVVFAVLAIPLIVSTVAHKKDKTPGLLETMRRFGGPLVVAVGMVVYVLVVDVAGYLIPSVILFLFVGWALGYRKYGRLAATGLAAVLIVYVVFRLALGVPLPSAPWWPG